MGSNMTTRRISTAVAAGSLAFGAGMALTASSAQAQEPSSQDSSVAAMCAQYYGQPGVRDAAHLLRYLHSSSTSDAATSTGHGLRCGQVARAFVVPTAPSGDQQRSSDEGNNQTSTSTGDTSTDQPTTSGSDEGGDSSTSDGSSKSDDGGDWSKSGDSSTSGDSSGTVYQRSAGDHYSSYQHDGWGHHGYSHPDGGGDHGD